MHVVVLHQLKYHARNKKLADICYVLNLTDTHIMRQRVLWLP